MLAELEAGYSIGRACKKAGIGRQTYYDWREEDPDFVARADEAIEMGTDSFEDDVTDLAHAGNLQALLAALRARRRLLWGDNKSLEVSGPGGGPLLVFFGEDDKGPG